MLLDKQMDYLKITGVWENLQNNMKTLMIEYYKIIY